METAVDFAAARLNFAPAEPYILWILTFIGAAMISLYLWFILYKGPLMMEARQPFNLTNTLRWYNLFQLFACTVFVERTYNMGFDFRFLWKCESFGFLPESKRQELFIGTWFFLFLRIFEFVETIFFILRKKKSQASFLHIYHHISTVTLMWIFMVYDNELMAIYNASINSFVHIVMYLYYFFSSYQNIRPYLDFYKPLITILQMVQFVLIMGHCIVAILPGCGAAGIFFYLQIVNLCVLFVLFGHFFITNYMMKKK